MTYEQWYENYKPVLQGTMIPDLEIEDSEHYIFDTYGPDYEKIKKANPYNVWTYHAEGEYFFIAPGKRLVNRIGYFITKKQWTDKDLDLVIEM